MTSLPHRPKPLVRVVDDDPTVLKALQTYLELADFAVHTYEGAEAFLEKDDPETPGCVILDVRMPRMSGIELHGELLRRKIDLPVIFLSGHGDIEMAVAAVKMEELERVIAEAIEENAEHRAKRRDYLSLRQDVEKLTPTETLVARMVVKGITNAVIADALGMAERTVKAHRAAVFEKLGVENALELSDFFHEIDDYSREFEAK